LADNGVYCHEFPAAARDATHTLFPPDWTGRRVSNFTQQDDPGSASIDYPDDLNHPAEGICNPLGFRHQSRKHTNAEHFNVITSSDCPYLCVYTRSFAVGAIVFA
jgi:hypothetical protein